MEISRYEYIYFTMMYVFWCLETIFIVDNMLHIGSNCYFGGLKVKNALYFSKRVRTNNLEFILKTSIFKPTSYGFILSVKIIKYSLVREVTSTPTTTLHQSGYLYFSPPFKLGYVFNFVFRHFIFWEQSQIFL